MPYAISLKCVNESALPILRLWDEAGDFEPVPSMAALKYPPHITLAVFAKEPPQRREMLKAVFAAQPALSVKFDGISYFENDTLVLWARPSNDTVLRGLHATLHRHFDPALCHEHYRVDQWVPHCSLATSVPLSKADAAKAWTNQQRVDFSVEFDTGDFVRFPPVVVEQEFTLTGAAASPGKTRHYGMDR